MSQLPEDFSARVRGAGITFILLALLIAISTWAIGWGETALTGRPPPSAKAFVSPSAAFAGASAKRVFLSEAESRDAARQGLLPNGIESILGTGGKLDFGEWVWDDAAVPPGPIAVRVDLKRQLVSVFRGPHEIGTAVIVYGIDGKETPRGKLPIRGKSRDYHSVTYDAPMPYSLWLREDGVALHGSSVSMGKATNGCIGVPVDFAGKLFEVAEKGDIIEVIG